jgi:hypothetical protein
MHREWRCALCFVSGGTTKADLTEPTLSVCAPALRKLSHVCQDDTREVILRGPSAAFDSKRR